MGPVAGNFPGREQSSGKNLTQNFQGKFYKKTGRQKKLIKISGRFTRASAPARAAFLRGRSRPASLA